MTTRKYYFKPIYPLGLPWGNPIEAINVHRAWRIYCERRGMDFVPWVRSSKHFVYKTESKR